MLLQVSNLSFAYDKRRILNNLSFSLKKGEVLAVIGPNGSGKTTLGHCLSGVAPHLVGGNISGEIFVNKKNILNQEFEETIKHTSFLLQDPDSQFSTLSVRDEIGLSLKKSIPKDKLNLEVQNIADHFGLGSLLDKSPQDLSMGQKQKVALASVLLQGTKLLILDEPGTTLDLIGKKKLLEMISNIKKRKIGIIILTHNFELIRDVADRVLAIKNGESYFEKPFPGINKQEINDLYGLVEKNVHGVAQSHKVKNKIKLENVYFKYPRLENYFLSDISLGIETNLGIAGLNGCGKSTLSLLASGLYKPCNGSVEINEQNIYKMDRRKLIKKIGIVFQNPNHQIFAPTTYEELAFGLINLGLDKNTIDIKVKEIASFFGFKNLKIDPSSLSFGWRKILSLASIIITEPEILVLDEPEMGLDLYFRAKFKHLVYNILNKKGIKLVIISHDLSLLNDFTDEIILLDKGKIVFQKETKEAIPAIKKFYDKK
jgi:energy-coupling factor transport system ATP-binding protein